MSHMMKMQLTRRVTVGLQTQKKEKETVMSSTKTRSFYTTGSRNFFTDHGEAEEEELRVMSPATLLQTFSDNFLFGRLLVILSTFLFSRRASSPLTEPGIVHTHILDSDLLYQMRRFLSLIIPTRILMQVYVKICIFQFLREYSRET